MFYYGFRCNENTVSIILCLRWCLKKFFYLPANGLFYFKDGAKAVIHQLEGNEQARHDAVELSEWFVFDILRFLICYILLLMRIDSRII